MHVARPLPHEVLAAPVETLDAAAVHRVRELPRRCGRTPTRIEDLYLADPPSLDRRRELAANRLDLGQLRHDTSFLKRVRPSLEMAPRAARRSRPSATAARWRRRPRAARPRGGRRALRMSRGGGRT